MDKAKARRALRSRRNALTASQQTRAAQALVDSVLRLPTWSAAQRIALYASFDGEIDTAPLAHCARECGKAVYLPVTTPNKRLQFILWNEDTSMDANQYGILQPRKASSALDADAMDIIFTPLVGWDTAGNRLGMGGGYYDRALAEAPDTLKVGLAHHCQQVSGLEPATWDVAMDYIATDTNLYDCALARKPV